MDPITAANALATIVQLLGIFAQERKGSKDLTHHQFVEWLQYHKHQQVVELICNTAAIQNEVTKLLRADHATIIAMLHAIDTTLAALLARVQALAPLALAVAPNSVLSEQAIFVLRQLACSSSRYLIFDEIPDGCVFQLESGEVLQYYDGRLLADDLATLALQGLLTPESSGSDSAKMYRITRAAVQFMEALGTPLAEPTPQKAK